MGAYLRLVSPGVPVLGAFMFAGIYKFPAYRFECHGVFTNKVPTDAYRGAGRPEATFAIERIMDELAVELGMDPLELRRKNWIKAEEFPFTTVAGPRVRQRRLRAGHPAGPASCSATTSCAPSSSAGGSPNDPVQLGIGFSTFTEMCGLAPSRVLGSLSYGAGGWEHASIRMLPTGKVEVVTGSTPHGQGHETAWSQLVADQLGVPFEDVEVLHGDTAISSAGPGHLRLPVARRRRHRGGQGRARRWSPRPARSPPTCSRPARTTSSSPAGSFSVRGHARAPGMSHPGDRAGHLRGAQLPGGHRALDRRRRDLRPGELLLPPRHAHLRHGGRHRDRHGEDPQVRLRRRRRQRSSTR